jgi:predicted PurR-regulated permease PerM
MWPFISALLWAVILSIALWPLHRRVVNLLGGRRTLAAVLMVGALVLLVLVPLLVVGASLGDNVQDLKAVGNRWLADGLPKPPAWLAKVPLVGKSASAKWENLASDRSVFREKLQSFVQPVSRWAVASGLSLGKGLLQLALSILISLFLLRDGPALRERAVSMADHIAGARGVHLLDIAGKTVRSVVYGVLGTAVIQAVLAGIGFVIVGVPSVPLLAFLTFCVCLLPAIGAPLVWVPVDIWLWHQGATSSAIFLIVWGLLVGSVDNFVKPWLISQGSDMPFLLIFFGALGGLAAFGFIGLFIGPTLLAVGYNLIEEWLASKPGESVSAENVVRLSHASG